MPRPKPELQRKSVLLRLSDDAIAALDRRRGDLSRSAYIEHALDGPVSRVMDQVVANQIAIQTIVDAPTVWPSGAVILPEHVADPGETAALRKFSVPLAGTFESRAKPKKVK